ncbi:MafI family immunity protein [Mucilaginibacter psychrotolerans]|uniref:MafI family immunity protein n=1 Tax=Mucilaginibacter psychrotolerans TaxID=1524096 RepID=UPI001305206D|nr:MafI family immunity protein [Mucilaginibacter psychrotolerans]
MFGYRKLNRALKELISKAKETALPQKDITSAEEFVEYGEPLLALEQLVEQLFEFSIPISAELYDAVEQCGILMDMPADKYFYLKELIK